MLRERLVIPYDEVELQHHREEEEASKYRDRAEERRRGHENDKDFVDADGNKIKLGGLDFDMLKKSREEIERKEKEMAHLKAMKEKAQIQLKKFHEQKMQQKQLTEQKKQLQSLKLSSPKILAPPKSQVSESDDDDIFGDVPKDLPIKETRIEPSNFEYEKKSDFNIKAYEQRTSIRDVKEEEKKKQQYEEEARVREKILRQQKMLREQEDYYTECYQKVSTSFDDDRKLKEEQDLVASVHKDDPKQPLLPRSVHFRGGNQQKGQLKKKKKEDFNKQLDDIEQIIKKRRA